MSMWAPSWTRVGNWSRTCKATSVMCFGVGKNKKRRRRREARFRSVERGACGKGHEYLCGGAVVTQSPPPENTNGTDTDRRASQRWKQEQVSHRRVRYCCSQSLGFVDFLPFDVESKTLLGHRLRRSRKVLRLSNSLLGHR